MQNVSYTLLLVAAALLTTAPQLTAAEGIQQPLEPMDIFDLQWVTDPRISPDAEKVTYVRARYDVMKDRTARSLWIMDADGDNHEPLTAAGVQSYAPRWSPDGSRLAYVVSGERGPQIHVRWMGSNRDIAITQLQNAPSGLTWSPDGNYLAFYQFVKQAKDPIATMPSKPKGAKWNDPPKVYEDPLYRFDGSGYQRSGVAQLFVVSATGGKARQLTDADSPHGGSMAWTPDAKAIYFSANYIDEWQDDPMESNLYRVDIDTLEVEQITTRDGSDHSPRVSPNGNSLVYLGADDTGTYQDTKLYITSTEEHEPRQLIDLGYPIANPQWSKDSRTVYFSFTQEGMTKVGRTNLNGKVDVLAEGLGGSAMGRPYSSASFSVANNGTIAHDVSLPDQPANLGVTRKGKTTVLTNMNKDLLATVEINPPEAIWYKSDGHDIQGWIVKPPQFDPSKKYPLILEIHGGPHTAYGDFFSTEVQLYAAAGYVVLYTNPRGSTSYGEDFALEISKNYPGPDYDDLMAGVDAVIEQGYIDTDNLFVTGGSGGGILTAWIVTKTDRFAAAVSQKPVINWYTMTFVSDIGSFFWTNWFDELPWENPARYLEKSPINHVNKVKTPTMLLTGEEDWRTPMSESEQFYQALHMADVPTALVRVPNSSHSIAGRPSGIIGKVTYGLGWFYRYSTDKKESEETTKQAD